MLLETRLQTPLSRLPHEHPNEHWETTTGKSFSQLIRRRDIFKVFIRTMKSTAQQEESSLLKAPELKKLSIQKEILRGSKSTDYYDTRKKQDGLNNYKQTRKTLKIICFTNQLTGGNNKDKGREISPYNCL